MVAQLVMFGCAVLCCLLLCRVPPQPLSVGCVSLPSLLTQMKDVAWLCCVLRTRGSNSCLFAMCCVPLVQMKDFALRGYKSATALAYHKAPNSPVGRVLGLVYG